MHLDYLHLVEFTCAIFLHKYNILQNFNTCIVYIVKLFCLPQFDSQPFISKQGNGLLWVICYKTKMLNILLLPYWKINLRPIFKVIAIKLNYFIPLYLIVGPNVKINDVENCNLFFLGSYCYLSKCSCFHTHSVSIYLVTLAR